MHIQNNFSLIAYNTFGLEVSCKFFIEITSLELLKEALIFIEEKKLKYLVLGSGSNILFKKDFDGVVLYMQIKGVEILQKNPKNVTVKMMAGEVWHDMVLWTLEQGYKGFENLVLIPGTVGAAPIQNIGAYGVEIKDYITEVEVLDVHNKQVETLSLAVCDFGYRDSVFKREKGRYIILSVTFKLHIGTHTLKTSYGNIQELLIQKRLKNPTARELAEIVMEIRKSKLPDPEVLGNSGSFFKNPVISENEYKELEVLFPDMPHFKQKNGVKIPAGWLIEKIGYKGKKYAQVGVHDMQALVLVNFGSATGKEVLRLVKRIQRIIKTTFGINLETEVNLV